MGKMKMKSITIPGLMSEGIRMHVCTLKHLLYGNLVWLYKHEQHSN